MAVRKFKPIQLTEQDISRFWSKVEVGGLNDCWPWTTGTDADGYGIFNINSHPFRSHRVAYYLHYKVDPGLLLVRHSCDNPPCCNGAHLLKGTEQDNASDMVERSRQTFGERHWNSKLTEADVREIHQRLQRRTKIEEVAQAFNVTYELIQMIKAGKIWKHIAVEFEHKWGTVGVDNASAKLDEGSVQSIRSMLADGKTVRECAVLFNVSMGTIYAIRSGKVWKHLPSAVDIAHQRPCNHKITPEDVRAIREMLKLGWSQRDVARHFGVHFGTVSDIHTGKTWRNVS